MHIPPGSGKASAVLKLQSLAIGMKSKTESEGDADGRKGREGGKKERQSSARLSRLFLFFFDLFFFSQFLLQIDSCACLKTK